jgi:hypothetical protein
MKKLLLTALLSAFVMGNIFAQFVYNGSAANYAIAGVTLKQVNVLDQDTLSVHYNTNVVNSTWLKSKKTPYTSDSVLIKKCQTQKGYQAIVYTDRKTTTSIQSTTFKNVAYGSNGNPVHVASLDSLLKVMAKSAAITTTVNGAAGDSLTAPAHCLFDVAGSTTNQVYGVYPGKYKHVEYGFCFNFLGKTVTNDITFDIDTYSAGTTGKTATYELSVYVNTGSISTFDSINSINSAFTNLAYRNATFYTTGAAAKSVNLSTLLGQSASYFNNKYVYVFLKTLGTQSDASGAVDGYPNATTGSNPAVTLPVTPKNTPVVYDPIIALDNFYVTFRNALWVYPVNPNLTGNEAFNHDNCVNKGTSPLDLGVATGTITTRTAVPVLVGVDTQVPFYITGSGRVGALTITEAISHQAKFAFAATGSIKRKTASDPIKGPYTGDVTYTYTPYPTATLMVLSIAAPTPGTVINDTLQINITTTGVTANQSVTGRFEINNGLRFSYDVGIIGSLYTANHSINLSNAVIWATENTVFVSNATESVSIFNVAGQKVKTVSSMDAAKGISVKSGIYIVKTGSTVQKVIVE